MPDRRLGVTIAADAANFIRGLRDAGQATKTLRGDLDQLSVTTKANAEAQVAATVKKTQRLRDEVVAYRGVAAAAQEGSREQVAAANLADRAQARLAASMGVTARESRAMSVSAAGVERDVSRAGRGALAGAGAFSGLGRSIAFASSWFLGGVGFVAGAKQSISAASDLDEQMQRTDSVFGASATGVKGWSTTSVQAMGLSRAAALDAADTIGTLLQNVGETPAKGAAMSQTFVQLASDMAAFKKVDPNVALNALESGLAGRTKSLKSFGLVLDTTTIKAEALAEGILKSNIDPGKVADLQTRVSLAAARVNVATTTHGAGSAQAVAATLQLHDAQNALAKAVGGTTGQLTAQQRTLAIYDLILKQTADQRGAFAGDSDQLTIKEQKFHAALTDTEAAIGNALLPTASKYIGEIGDWLSSSENQAKVQKDVTEAVNAGVTVFHYGADALRIATKVTGGFTNALEILIGLKLAGTVAGWTTRFKEFGAGISGAAAETTASATVIGTETKAIGAESAVAAGEVNGLRASLLSLGTLGEIAVGVVVTETILRPIEKDVSSKIKQTLGGKASSIYDYAEGAATFGGIGKNPATAVGDFLFGDGKKKQPAPKKGKNLLPGLGESQSQSEMRAAQALGVSPAQAKANQAAFATAPVPGTPGAAPGPAPLSKGQQLQLALAKSPNDVALLKQKAAADDAAIAFLNKRHAAGKVTDATYIQEYKALYADRDSTEATITGLTTKAATDAKTAAKQVATIPMGLQVKQAFAATTPGAADDEKVNVEIRTWAEQLIKSQHLKGQALIDALGLIATANQSIGAFAVPFAIQLGAAKAALTKSTADDIKNAKALKAYALQELKGKKLSDQGQLDALAALGQADQTLGTAAPSKSIRLVTGADVTKGLKLSRNQKLAIESRYAQAQAHGGQRPTGVGVLGQTVNINVNVTGNGDTRKVADEIVKHLQRNAQLGATQTRGLNAGRGPIAIH